MVKRYVLSDEVVFREIGGEVLLVPVMSSVEDLDSIYSVGGSGAKILGWLDHPCSEEELLAHITESFKVDREQARRDLLSFLADLETCGLIRATEEEGN